MRWICSERRHPSQSGICSDCHPGYAMPHRSGLRGYLDDVILLPTLIVITVKLIPAPVFERCRAQSEGIWKDGKPKKWVYAIPIVLIWLVIIALLLKAIIF